MVRVAERKLPALLQGDKMSDTASTAAESSRGKVSNRIYIDAQGQEVDSPVEALGAKYESLTEAGAAAVALFEGEGENVLPKEAVYGLAAFGFLTLAGNQTNTVRNGDPKEGQPQTEKEALDRFLANLLAGNWTSARGETEPGITLLAEAIARAKQAEDGKERQVKDVAEWLKGQDKEFKKKLRARPAIKKMILAIQTERLEGKEDEGIGDIDV